jgi:S-(hydroxymethyl)mycothiol dehydrogenase
MQTRGVVVRGPGAPAEVEEIEIDPPGAGEVLVRIVATGVCHSDLHCKLGNFGVEFPYLLGHEGAGVVEAVGDGVTRPRVGDTVVAVWRAPCGTCRFCVAGNPTFCVAPLIAQPRMRTRDGKVLGRVLGTGTFATHTVLHAAQAIPIPADLSMDATCLIGCGVATGAGAVLNAARVPAGATVAVIGCGAVGMSVILGARVAAASRIVAVDLIRSKLERARQLGATDAVDARGDAAKEVRKLTGGGVQYAFEAVGLPATVKVALAACELGGTCTLIGVPAPTAEVSINLARFFFSRVKLQTTFYGDCLPARDVPLLADLYRRGALPLDELVSERIGLHDVEAAFARMQAGETLRSIIHP